jgi:hypothetical protein
MTDVGIQTDELYINGMPLREFLLLDIPQTHYLKMIDDVDGVADAYATNTSSETDAQEEEEETFTQEEIDALYYAILDYVDYVVTPNISLFSDPHFHKKVELGVYEFLELAFSDMCGIDLFMITYDMEVELECIVEN